MDNNKIKQLIIDLVKIPSFVDDKNNEAKVIEFIEKYAKKSKFKVIKQKVEGNRSNLIIRGKTEPKVILFGHTDTVLPKSKNATTPIEKGNKLYGLGSVDMKSGVAVMLNQLEKFDPESGLCLILTVDEEYEFKGAEKLISKYKFTPDYIINIEPTDLNIMQGCRGITEFSFELKGKTAHASRKDLGINAIEATMKIYEAFEDKIATLNKKGTAKSSLNIAHLFGGIESEEKITYAANVVPNYAKTVGEIRIGHKQITEKWVKELIAKESKKLGVKVNNLKFKFYLGSMFTEKSKMKKFAEAVKESKLDVNYADINRTGYYEVQIPYTKWGDATTIIFGPGPSNKCHMEDEFVDLKTVYKTNEVITKFLEKTLK